MKIISITLLCLLTIVMMVGMVGCVTAEKQDAMMKLAYRYEMLQKELLDLREKYDSGELTSGEVKEKVEDVSVLIDDTLAEYNSLKDEGYTGTEIASAVGSVLLNLVLSFFGVNVYRSRKHPLSKEMK